ncbi:hypothetical protein BLOT_005494 [Blomia tropicalis]|nr:hypothetical protein BLOT_005494 [Blomia tropicalis]
MNPPTSTSSQLPDRRSLEICQLDKNNWSTWKLRVENLMEYYDVSFSDVDNSSPTISQEIQRKQKLAKQIIVANVGEMDIIEVIKAQTSTDAWDYLENKHGVSKNFLDACIELSNLAGKKLDEEFQIGILISALDPDKCETIRSQYIWDSSAFFGEPNEPGQLFGFKFMHQPKTKGGWFLNSGANIHATSDRSLFTSFTEYTSTIGSVSGDQMEVCSIGNVTLLCTVPDGDYPTVLNRGLYDPDIACNILSVKRLSKSLNFSNDCCRSEQIDDVYDGKN